MFTVSNPSLPPQSTYSLVLNRLPQSPSTLPAVLAAAATAPAPLAAAGTAVSPLIIDNWMLTHYPA
jgi:hypothetical protein